MHKFSLEQFEGPLDLLLQLIEKQKLQITEISLAKVTDQYLNYLDQNKDIPKLEVADFLLIASKLIYLKSKYLLPNLELEADAEVNDLEKQLKIYRQYYEASKKFNRLWMKNKISYGRLSPFKLPPREGFFAPANLDLILMSQLFSGVLGKIKAVVNLPKIVMQKAVSIGEKITHIRNLIKNAASFSFHHLITEKNNKTEAIVSFLAMLELVKQREIDVSQDSLFGEVKIFNHPAQKINF